MVPSFSRNAQLVKFFAQQRRGIPRKHLVKVIYMTDLLAREYLGQPVSEFVWYRYKNGPYDKRIEDAVQELVDEGYVEDTREPWWKGRYHRVVDLHRPMAFDFSLAELAVLDYVVSNYVHMDTNELVEDVVYKSAPFIKTSRLNERLPMKEVNHTGTEKVLSRLDEVVRAEQEAKAGDFVTLSEFVNELRAKAPA